MPQLGRKRREKANYRKAKARFVAMTTETDRERRENVKAKVKERRIKEKGNQTRTQPLGQKVNKGSEQIMVNCCCDYQRKNGKELVAHVITIILQDATSLLMTV